MYAPQASCGVVFVKLSFHVMGFALRLKLAQVFQHALPFGRRYLFFFGGFSFFPEIALSLGNLTVVVFYYGFCLLVGRHERPVHRDSSSSTRTAPSSDMPDPDRPAL